MKNVINVKGSIISNDEAWIYELFEIEHTSPQSIDKALLELENKDNLIIEINSGGGSVFAGSEIYTKLKKLAADVEIVGLAGSAASFIAMAGKKVSISPTAQIMIHNASTVAIGNKEEMDDTSDFLNSIDSSIAYAYQLKTGLEIAEISKMMTKETWLNAKESVSKGFADEIMFSEQVDAVASVGMTLPKNVIDKVRNIMKKDPDNSDRLSVIEKQLQAINEKMNNKNTEKPIKNDWLF